MLRMIGVLLVIACTAACASQVLLVPQRTVANANKPLPRTLLARQPEQIVLANEHGNTIGALLFETRSDYGTVMVSAGNAMGRRETSRYTEFLHDHGFRVLIFRELRKEGKRSGFKSGSKAPIQW